MPARWSFLPFVGASTGHGERDGEDTKEESEEDGDNQRFSHQQTAAEFARMDEEDIVLNFNAPISWWVSSSLFPLIAGTFGPMASAFNIMAVAINWRTTISPLSVEAEGTFITDPRWLVGVNAASLAIAIVANLTLLAQMGGQLRFNVASPITIVGWLISGFIDIGLVAAAPSCLPLPADQLSTYSQAYYYAVFAGALYIMLSTMLMVTAYGAWVGKHSSEFKLTMAQRSLMLQTMLFLGYVLAAGAVYARVEDWIYLDACYFIVVTLFTIGFGDLTPSTHLGRGLEFPMAAGGIVFVGLIIANIRTLVIESASKKVSLRLLEKARIRALRHPEVQDGIIKVRGFQRRDTNAPTELERRENEFNIMREIQATAIADNRRLTLGLSLSAFCILWFIGAVIFWQAEKAPGGQNWSYFEALYFTYVAQLTIGYGDLAPQTNSSKPAFVFWALIALPTLTVLIGAVGDAASDFVNWSFVWIGKHSKDLWRLSKTLTKTPHKTKELVKQACEETGDTSTEHAFSDISYIDSNHLAPRVEHEDGVEKVSARDASGDKRRHFVILRTARRILAHLEEDEPRKYTFQEWTWLLRLLGEDENHEAGHRRLGVEPQAGTSALKISPKHRKWSWLGQESPLVDVQNDGEPRWVLKRLLQSLEEEIRNVQSSHSAIASSEPENR